MPLTLEGYEAKRAAEWRRQIRDSYENQTGANPDWERDTFIANITAIMADRLGELSQGAQSVYETFDVAEARGVYLDVLASLYDISRLRATSSTVQAYLEGSPGATIKAGIEVRDIDGNDWLLDEDVTLDPNGVSSGTVRFVSEKKGAIQIDAYDIDTRNDKGAILTTAPDLDNVYNDSKGAAGRDEETDDELRQRVQSSQSRIGGGSILSLQSTLVEEVVDIESAFAIENDSQFKDLVLGEQMLPHSYTVFIYPETPTVLTSSEYKKQIAETLIEKGPSGIRAGSENFDTFYDIPLNDGYEKRVRWNWVTSIPVDIKITVDEKVGQSIGQSTVVDEVQDYFNQLDPNENVRQLPIYSRLGQYDAIADVTLLQFDRGPGYSQSVNIDLREVAAFSSIQVSF